jgi:hypothetical protein
VDRLAAALALALQAGPDFAADLRGLAVDRLLEIADSFDVDVIEVIGHTDEQPITSRISNLDRRVSSVARQPRQKPATGRQRWTWSRARFGRG